MGKVIDNGKVDRWLELLAEHETSGESVVEFSARHGVPVHQFYWWRRRLCGSSRRKTTERASGLSDFVPVRVTLSPPTPMIEVVHPGGCVVRVSSGVDSGMLRSVFEALRTVEA